MGEKFSFGSFIFGSKRKRHGKVEQANFDFWTETDESGDGEEGEDIGSSLDKILFLLVPMVILFARMLNVF